MVNHPNVKPKEILVLSTRRAIGYAIRDELIALGRSAQSFFAEQCLDKQIAKEGYVLLMLLVRPEDRSALRAWLGIDHKTVQTSAYKRIWRDAEAAGVSPRQLLDNIVAGRVQAPPHTDSLIDRYRELSSKMTPLAGQSGVALIDLLWPPADPDCADIRGIALTIPNTIQSPAEMLEELVTAVIQPELPGNQDDIIRVMSLFKSKGLTAKCVVVAGCMAGALPSFKPGLSSIERQQALEEQRRLFYVAITRTTETLFLSCAATGTFADAKQMSLTFTHSSRGSVTLQSSPFWSELGQHAPRALSGGQLRSSLGF